MTPVATMRGAWTGGKARLLQHRRSGGCVLRKNEVGPQLDDFPRKSLHQLHVGRRPPSVDPDIAVLRPAELLESLAERRDKGRPLRVALGICHQHVDPPHPLRLLSACGEGPRCRACERRDELAPSQWIYPHVPSTVSRTAPASYPKMAYRGQGVCGPTSQRTGRPTECLLLARTQSANARR